jgi:NTE family protein
MWGTIRNEDSKINREDLRLTSLNNIENLVFQGGGVRGIAYLGALKTLCDEENSRTRISLDQIKRVGGASAGAITSLFLALGKSLEDIGKFLNKDFKQFLDEEKCETTTWTYRDVILKIIEVFKNKVNYLDTSGEDSKDEVSKMDLFIIHFFEFLKKLGVDLAGRKSKEQIEQEIKKLGVEGILEHAGAFFEWLPLKLKYYFHSAKEQFIGWLAETIAKYLTGNKIAKLRNTLQKKYFDNKIELLNNYFFSVHDTLMKVAKNLGVFSGDQLLKLFQAEIKSVTGDSAITFQEFHHRKQLFHDRKIYTKDLYVIALNLHTGITAIFSHTHTPTVIIADAVRASMCIPYFFVPHQVRCRAGTSSRVVPYKLRCTDATHQEKEYIPTFVDGGVSDNFPIWLFDRSCYLPAGTFFSAPSLVRNQKTLGFRLVEKRDKELFESRRGLPSNDVKEEKYNIMAFSWSLAGAFIKKQDSDHYHNGDYRRTIYIDTKEVDTTEFDLSKQNKTKLLNSGKSVVFDYLDRLSVYENKYYEYTIARSSKHAIYTGLLSGLLITGGAFAIEKYLFRGTQKALASPTTASMAMAVTAGCSATAAFSSSLVVNSTIFGNKVNKKQLRQNNRALGTGILMTLVIFGICKNEKSISLSASLGLSALCGFLSTCSSYMIDRFMDVKPKRLQR